MNNDFPPVAFFCYNRPVHTERVLTALSLNDNAAKIKLYAFIDGPKINADSTTKKNIDNVRKIVSSIDWCAEVIIVARNINMGLGNSIRNGLNEVFNRHSSVIVLEDDLIPQKGFLNYMNFYLEEYRNKNYIYHVSAFQRDCYLNFLLKDIYLTHFMNCSGWGTWKDRWEKTNWDYSYWSNALVDMEFKSMVNYNNYLRISEQINLNRDECKTWAIFWYLTIMENRGLCVNPKQSYIQNIGDDGSGTNMGKTKLNNVKILNHQTFPQKNFRINSYEDKLSKKIVQEAYGSKSKIRFRRLKGLIFRLYYVVEKFNTR
jgi:hypothetical protein